jgi:hypothetical protein
MRTLLRALPVMALVLAACNRNETPKVDEALRQDLSLASQLQPYAPQPYVSPVEMGYDAYGRPVYQSPVYRGGAYPQPVPVATRQAPRTIYRAPSSGGSAPAATVEVRNTKRDAILGAAAGAAIGAVSSRDRLKGAVIGAAAGGVLGAIYGQKVDVNKIPR